MSVRFLADTIEEELKARGWSVASLACRMLVQEFRIEVLALEMLLACRDDPHIIVSDDTCERLDRAFGVSAGFARRLADSAPIIGEREESARLAPAGDQAEEPRE